MPSSPIKFFLLLQESAIIGDIRVRAPELFERGRLLFKHRILHEVGLKLDWKWGGWGRVMKEGGMVKGGVKYTHKARIFTAAS